MRAIERTLHELAGSDPASLYERAQEMRAATTARNFHRAARRFYMLAALMGHGDSKYQLGIMNLRGEGRPVDRVRSAMWLKLASAGGDLRSARNLQMVASEMRRADVDRAFGLARLFPEAEQALRAAVLSNDAEAMVRMGEYVAQGRGVEHDPEMASEWYRRAVVLAHPRAQLRLGLASLNGEGIARDAAEGRRLLERAAAQDNADAQFALAQLLQDQVSGSAARSLYEKAAAQGNAGAQLKLGELYKDGEIPLPDTGRVPAGRRDIAPHLMRAFDWFGKAARQGEPAAQCELGQMYAQGMGTKQDFAQAAHWYREAAAQGHAKAQFNLGFLHAHGQGVIQDDEQAYHWYRLSELGGYEPARQSAALAARKLSEAAKELADWRIESFVNTRKEA